MTSLRGELRRAGLPAPVAIPDAFGAHPPSLLACVRMLRRPAIAPRDLERRMLFERDYSRTQGGQGVAYGGGDRWFLSARDRIERVRDVAGWIPDPPGGLPIPVVPLEVEARVTLGELRERARVHDASAAHWDHIGDVDRRPGLVLTSVETKDKATDPVLVALTDDLDLVGWATLTTTDRHAAWCALDPWHDHVLYVPTGARAAALEALDISPLLRRRRDRTSDWGRPITLDPLPGRRQPLRRYAPYPPGGPGATRLEAMSLSHIQGVTITPAGRVYVTIARSTWGKHYDNHLHVFEAVGGALTGSSWYDLPGWGDEFEGLTHHPSGAIIAASADWGGDLYLHRFRHRDPAIAL